MKLVCQSLKGRINRFQILKYFEDEFMAKFGILWLCS